MEKAGGSTAKASSKIVKELGNSKIPNHIVPFSLTIHIVERPFYFDILDVFQ